MFLNSLKTSSKNEWIKAVICLIVGVILIYFTTLSTSGQKSMSFELSENNSSNGVVTYSPGISLPKGDYSVRLSGGSLKSEINIKLVGSDGTEYASSMSTSGTSNISLPHDVTELKVMSNGKSSSSVTSINITSKNNIYTDSNLLAFLLLLGLLLLTYFKFIDKSKDKTSSVIYVFLVLIGVLSTYPFFTAYLQTGDDIGFHLARIEGVKDALISGQLPARIDASTANGYGYPTGIFYGNLFLYFPAILRLMGVSLMTAYKTFYLAVNIATAFVAYFSIKGVTKSKYAGLIGSVAYTFSTWRLICLFSRAAMGESLAMIFFPLFILGIYHIIFGDKKKWWILSLAFTFVLQSHLINTVMGAMIVLFVVVFSLKKLFSDGRIWALIKAAVLTLLLNIWFLIPFFMMYTGMDLNILHSASAGNFQNGSIIPAQLFNILNNKQGISQVLSFGISSDMSLSLGIVTSVGFVICFAYYMFAKPENRIKQHRMGLALFVFSVLAMFMATSLFPWDYLREKYSIAKTFENLLQFPWRFLSPVSAVICILSAMILANNKKLDKKKMAFAITSVAVIGFILFGMVYTESGKVDITKGVANTQPAVMGATEEYLPKGAKSEKMTWGLYNTSSGIDIENAEKNYTNVKYDVTGNKSGWTEVPLTYYIGYTAKDQDGKKLDVTAGTNGVVRVSVNDNTKSVKITYGNILPFRMGDIISLLTVLLCLAYTLLKKKFGFDIVQVAKEKLPFGKAEIIAFKSPEFAVNSEMDIDDSVSDTDTDTANVTVADDSIDDVNAVDADAVDTDDNKK